MNPPSIEQYAIQLDKNQAHTIPGAYGTFWARCESYSMMRVPIFCLDPPNSSEIRHVLWRGHVAVVSYLLEPDALHPANAYLYIADDNSYRLEKLSRPARRDARRALRSLKVTFVDWSTLTKKGFAAFRDTRNRVGLSDGTAGHFRRKCESLSRITGHLVVGAWKKDILVAYMILSIIDGFVEIAGSYSTNENRRLCPNNGLAHFVLDYFLARKRFKVVCFGVNSLQPGSDKSGLHRFKIKVGFQARPVHRAFVFHPLVRPLVNKMTLLGLKALLKLSPGSRPLRKNVGVLEMVMGKGGISFNDKEDLYREK